ncbi:MAG: 2-oxoglutarate ferredoxin oxidoreductase subunit alpha [Methanosaeta sp. NSM2]|nr:2-oxoacid:acceptor oxidoreductase subunit alpha [Methanothrix sp.]OYV12422.1 MAG: 2-oxoglutarate ferredoxin oxidoreductase subunit alpha [Methanosaeta sp. NSM2]
MKDFSTLIGGIAGDGINEAGMTVSRLLSRLGYHIYMYYDYPSLIRGGHNFSLIRACRHNVAVHTDAIDVLIALNQDTVEKHKHRLKESSFVIYDADKVKLESLPERGCGLAVTSMLKEAGAPAIMKNSCILGGYCKVVGIDWPVLEDVLRKHMQKKLELNLLIARQGYEQAEQFCRIDALLLGSSESTLAPMGHRSLLTGNQAISLGLIQAGLGAYVAYPMTPSSSVLDFMARYAADFGLKVIHPESEIAVMLMALGFSYAGVKSAVGTSGGGFCLMTEGLSLAGMAELPVVVVMAQRAGPSTGLPTYTAQGDLHFVLHAGQGEFPRLVVAPGDAIEAYIWAGRALNLAWKYQIPSIIMSDKTLSESLYSFDGYVDGEAKEEPLMLWSGNERYKRYLQTDSGISPLAFPPQKGQAIKTDSYMHDQQGITSEDPGVTREMSEKRQKKGQSLAREMEEYETVKVYGQASSNRALLFWGSNKGVCLEAAERLGLRAVQVLVLSPFPKRRLIEALQGVERLLAVECNAAGQLADLAACYGIKVDDRILKYDGRPFSLEDLLKSLGGAGI